VFLEVVLDVFQPAPGGSRLFSDPAVSYPAPAPQTGQWCRADPPRESPDDTTGSMIHQWIPVWLPASTPPRTTGSSSGMGTNGIPVMDRCPDRKPSLYKPRHPAASSAKPTQSAASYRKAAADIRTAVYLGIFLGIVMTGSHLFPCRRNTPCPGRRAGGKPNRDPLVESCSPSVASR